MRVDQPVVNGEGLVGKVKSVSDGNAIVMLLTDQEFGVSAKAARARRAGLDRPRRRRPRRPAARARPDAASTSSKGERVVTAGTVSTRLQSLFPPGILIGTVTASTRARASSTAASTSRPPPTCAGSTIVQVLTQAEHRPAPRPTAHAVTPTARAIVRLAAARRCVGVHPAADRGLADHRSSACPPTSSPLLVALGRPAAAARSPARAVRLRRRPVRRHRAAADARRLLARAHRRRLRRRPPARAARPRPRRSSRSRSAPSPPRSYAIGFAVLQFLLGVDAPVSLLLVRQILLDDRAQHAARAAGATRSCAACCSPFLPDDPRRRRRRAYTTGGLSPLSRA